VRRLAAVVMHGPKGRRARALGILAEFLFGAVVGPLFGLFVVVTAGSVSWRLIGLALIGVGLNYVPLARHALALRAPGALATELDGVDVKAEVQRYALRQLWVCVPLAVVVFDRRQAPGSEVPRSL
jgi:MFS family permease